MAIILGTIRISLNTPIHYEALQGHPTLDIAERTIEQILPRSVTYT
ncbi:MAG: hypothetical protein K9M94_04325 [Spirochaetia bacterium]|nr:hypothetical protein [Spirochaetia bacterium]